MKFVTGAGGFLGRELVVGLNTKSSEEVVALRRSHKPDAYTDMCLSESTVIYGDILDFSHMREIIAKYEIDEIYHLAANAIVKTAHKYPVETARTNILGTANILEVARICDVNKILIQTTDKVYGDNECATENSNFSISEIYGTSKICADLLAQTYAKMYGMSIYITRPTNIYGYDSNNRIIPNTIRNCLNGESPVIYSSSTPMKRQYLYVDDWADAIRVVMGKSPGIFNIPGNIYLDQASVVEMILEHFPDIEPRYISVPDHKEIASTFVEANFNWEAKTPFEYGINQTIEKFRCWQ